MLEARKKELATWQQFNAKEQAEELIRQGYPCVPLPWVETDKNEPLRLRTPGKYVEPLYNARLVTRGDLEPGDPRSDSPTIDIEGQNLLFSFASSKGYIVSSLDITNAYFQGEEMHRLLILKPPKGTDLEGLSENDYLMARVPVYGTHDAGRKFWKRLRKYLEGKGLQENFIFCALYTFRDETGEPVLMLGSHVDDLIWACHPKYQYTIDDLIQHFQRGKVEQKKFRYCGKEGRST